MKVKQLQEVNRVVGSESAMQAVNRLRRGTGPEISCRHPGQSPICMGPGMLNGRLGCAACKGGVCEWVGREDRQAGRVKDYSP
jgi:hypothetical protein